MPSYSTYPGGKPGVGLMLLRAAVGATVLVEGGIDLVNPGPAPVGRCLVGLLAITSGAFLLVGFFTKAAGVLAGLIRVGLWWVPALSVKVLDSPLSVVFVIIMSVAITLLGPGAYSLDARLFGRREIIIPRPNRPPQN